MKKITILDSTLRDGAQGENVSFSVQDKIHICKALDNLGVSFIEAGNPFSNPKDMEFFKQIKKVPLQNAKICAFGSTRHVGISCAEDKNIERTIENANEQEEEVLHEEEPSDVMVDKEHEEVQEEE